MHTRDDLHQEIIATQADFHKLLAAIPDAAFSLPSDNPAWTIGEVLYHMSVAPRMMVLDVQMIGRQRWLFRLIPCIVPKQVFHWLNAHLTHLGARNLSRSFLAESYDRATTGILRVLNSLSENDLEQGITYPNWDPYLSGEVSLAYLFGYIKRHFETHAEQLQPIVQKSSETS